MPVHTPTSDQDRTFEALTTEFSDIADGAQIEMLPNGYAMIWPANEVSPCEFEPYTDSVVLVKDDGRLHRLYRGQTEYFKKLASLETLSNVQIQHEFGEQHVRGPVQFVCYAESRPSHSDHPEGEECVARIMINPTGSLAKAWDPSHVVETVAAL